MEQSIWTFGKMCEIVPVGAIAALIVSIYFKRKNRKELAEFFWWVTLLGIACAVLVAFTLTTLAHLQTVRYDLYVNALERFMGYPANRVAVFLADHPILKWSSFLDYELYGALILVALVPVAVKLGIAEAKDLFIRFLLSGALVVPFYLIFPVSGPDGALPGFPAIYSGPLHTVSNSLFPNCIPSEHFAMALLVLWGLRKWRWGIVAGITHVALTTISTLGFGLHYATDLILAVPYTWLIIQVPLAYAPLKPTGRCHGADIEHDRIEFRGTNRTKYISRDSVKTRHNGFYN